MKREAKHLLRKAMASLTLATELFNRPHDTGRQDTVLILLDHANEMLLKAAIVHRGGRIREPRGKETYGFDKCVRVGLSEGNVRFLDEDQALLLQAVNGMRDAAQHHLIEVDEGLLYVYAQGNVTLFNEILQNVFGEDLREKLPRRALPLSTIPPVDITTLFEGELDEVKKLLSPGTRKRTDARARLKPLAIMNSTLAGSKHQPSDRELDALGLALTEAKGWEEVFPEVASLKVDVTSSGPTVSLRVTKKEGVPIHIVPEGTEGASVVAIRRVDTLGFYSLGRDQVAEKLGITGPKTSALIEHTGILDDPDCFRELRVGKALFKRYSPKAVERLEEALKTADMERVWRDYRRRRQHGRKRR